jgi:hypothetical protein
MGPSAGTAGRDCHSECCRTLPAIGLLVKSAHSPGKKGPDALLARDRRDEQAWAHGEPRLRREQ